MKEKKEYIPNRIVRFNKKEHNKLQPILENHFKSSFSKFVKFHINNKFNYDNNMPIKDTKINPKILGELSKIGVNFNQTVRFLNSNKNKIDNISFNKLENELANLSNQLREIRLKIMNDDN